MVPTSALHVLSEFLADLYRLQEPAEVLRTVDRWARRLVPYDFAVPALTARSTGSVALAGVPGEFAESYGRHAGEDAARLAHLEPAHPGAVRLSERVPARTLQRSAIWNELLRPHRIRHVMATCLVENPRVTGVLKMVRVDGHDFSDAERDTIALAAPHVRLAYANAEAMSDLAREAERLHLVCDGLEAALALVSARGAVLYQNARAGALLRRCLGGAPCRGPRDAARLPDALARLVAEGGRYLRHESPDGVVLEVRAARVGDGEDAAVLLRLDGSEASRGPRLSARQREVLHWVAEGKTILGISARTVQTHLEHVFAKMGVVSRAQAVAEALRVTRGSDR